MRIQKGRHLKEPKQSWATATNSWEQVHHNWEVMIGQPVLLGTPETGEKTVGFAVIARHRDKEQEHEGVGADVGAALAHLTRQIQHQGAE